MRACIVSIAVAIASVSSPAQAEWLGADQGKLHLTAGFGTLEGAGGGALTPFAFIAGHGSEDSWGAGAHATELLLRDVELRAVGLAVGVLDRIEVSYGRQELEFVDGPLDRVGVSMDIIGAKVRLFGDAVYGQGSWLPQVAIGSQYKRHNGIENFALTSVTQLGAQEEDGLDYYMSATKLSLAHNFVVNVTLRATEGNQLGLLGFGGDRDDGYQLCFETTVAFLLTRKLAVGAEYRGRPRNLNLDEETAAWDAFIAWAPSKHLSVVAAYANIGSLLAPATLQSVDQEGGYVSVQVGF
jgi:hypothetical protein